MTRAYARGGQRKLSALLRFSLGLLHSLLRRQAKTCAWHRQDLGPPLLYPCEVGRPAKIIQNRPCQLKFPDAARGARCLASLAVGIALEVVLPFFLRTGPVQDQRFAAGNAEHRFGNRAGSAICFGNRSLCACTFCTMSHCSGAISGPCEFSTSTCSFSGL